MIVLGFRVRIVARRRPPREVQSMGAKTDQIMGRGKKGLGAITGDKKMKEKGEIQEEEGKVEETIDSAVDKTKDALEGLKKTVKRN
jgi:uncharacterized protein YjbJ (UPF0337 family)